MSAVKCATESTELMLEFYGGVINQQTNYLFKSNLNQRSRKFRNHSGYAHKLKTTSIDLVCAMLVLVFDGGDLKQDCWRGNVQFEYLK